MTATRLVLVEGMPGAGKSTLAQSLARLLAERGTSVTWWYEEDKRHPLYVFDDLPSLESTLDDLKARHFEKLIAAALDKWRNFAADVATSAEVVVLESCLFGYLTWSLFPFGADQDLIVDYVQRVERLIRACAPRLIYLRPSDVTGTLRHVCETRGQGWTQSFVDGAHESPYHEPRGLEGFDRLVAYWTDYRAFADNLYERLAIPKLTIDPSITSWSESSARAAEFLSLTANPAPMVDPDLGRFVGAYSYRDGDAERTCEIRIVDRELVAVRFPGLWQRNRLVPASRNRFSVASFPFELSFDVDAFGAVQRAHLHGRELLDGAVERELVKQAQR